MMTILAVYGTLKKGFYNHDYLMKEATYIGKAILSPETVLYNLGRYPGLKLEEPSEDTGVEVELYEVTKPQLDRLDRFEGHPNLFKRVEVTIDSFEIAEEPSWDESKEALKMKKAQVYLYNQPVHGKKRLGKVYL